MSTVFGRTLVLLPSSPAAPASIEYRANPVTAGTVMPFTLQQQVYDWQQGIMEWSVMWPPLDQNQAAEFEGFILACHGLSNVFQLGDPRRSSPRGSGSGTPVVFGQDQTGYLFSTSGWTPNAAGVLLRGDYIQLGYRLYRATAQVDADAMGLATVPIWPPLRESPNGGGSPPVFDPLVLHDTKGLWMLKNNSTSWTQRPDRYYDLTFEIREAI